MKSSRPARRLMFTFIDQSVQAAVRGQGVVLTRTPFVDDLVASERLDRPVSEAQDADRLSVRADRECEHAGNGARVGVLQLDSRRICARALRQT